MLPEGYTQLLYINTNTLNVNNSAYFNTGISPNDMSTDPIVIARFRMNTPTGEKIYFGGGASTGASGTILYNYQSAANVLYARFGDKNYSGWAAASGHTLRELNFTNKIGVVKLALYNGKPAAYLGNTLISTKNITPVFDSTNGILVGATSNAGDADWYQFVLKDGSTVKFNGIPCKNPQGEVGMFDLVSQQFFASESSRPFIAGTEIGILNADSYIQSGLVFQLDGKDYGNQLGHWIERKNGYDWYEYRGRDAHLRDDCMVFDGTYSPKVAFTCDTALSGLYPISTCSIEVCFRNSESGWCGIVCLRNNVGLWKPTSAGYIGGYGSTLMQTIQNAYLESDVTFHCYNGTYIVNGQTDITGTNTNSRTSQRNVIGALDYLTNGTMSPYRMNGRIYSIRIYNRELTSDEIMWNYEIDYIRFNRLGV